MLGIQPANEPLPPKVWNAHLDRYLETGNFNPDIIPHLDAYQMSVINEIKKSFNRIKAKYARQTPQDTK